MKQLTTRQMVLWSLVGTVLFEAVTVLFRFGLGWEWGRDTASTVGHVTFGIRIHHGFIGLLCIVAAWALWRKRPAAARVSLVAGIALFLSDLIHHFLILWPIVGAPEFDLGYP